MERQKLFECKIVYTYINKNHKIRIITKYKYLNLIKMKINKNVVHSIQKLCKLANNVDGWLELFCENAGDSLLEEVVN